MTGTDSWGTYGSSDIHARYIEPIESRRYKCSCGCDGKCTHRGMANGVNLIAGCELSMRRWQRDGAA